VSFDLADGVILVVDIVEGMTSHLEQIIQKAVESQLPLVLFLNKMDRLVLELRLPPNDAYLKIKYVIEQVNKVVCKYDHLQL